MTTMTTMAAHLMKVAIRVQTFPDLSLRLPLARPMLSSNPLAKPPCPLYALHGHESVQKQARYLQAQEPV